VSELNLETTAQMEELISLGGFPEPYFSRSPIEAQRWSRAYRSRVIQEEIRDLERIDDLGKLELLMLRLPELVGSPLSINAVREDLQVAHKTIERWLGALERIYSCYRIAPLASSQIKALRKSQKYYLYNWSVIENPGSKFENFVGSHLLKWVHFQQDVFGKDLDLVFIRDITGKEVDFGITENRKLKMMIECKLSSITIDPNLKYYSARFPQAEAIQVVQSLPPEGERTIDGIRVRSALNFLKELT
jgi:predicted AAA+ superfamily ATPase